MQELNGRALQKHPVDQRSHMLIETDMLLLQPQLAQPYK
jgi:hypothetical protein